MENTLPKIAIIGRPNVGKSSLFNRFLGVKTALVHDRPGITRDRKYETLTFPNESALTLVDTAGLEEGAKNLASRMNNIAQQAIDEADAIMFVIDGSVGITPADQSLAKIVQKANKPILFVINKADTKACIENQAEFYSLGFKELFLVSAAHGIGIRDVMEALEAYAQLPVQGQHVDVDEPGFIPLEEGEEDEETIEEIWRPEWLRLAIVGRPNAGKSTLVNAFLGEERMLTGDEAGLTRESNSSRTVLQGHGYELVDTAGLRKKAKVAPHKVEGLSATDTLTTIAKAHVVLLLLDATEPFEKQDKTIAAHVVDEGKPLIIGLNKWDLVKDKNALLEEMSFMLEKSFAQVKEVPVVHLSALKNKNLNALLKPIEELYNLWNMRISTGRLNRFLRDATTSHPPPLTKDHRPVKMKYISQSGVRPPTFKIWCNRPKAVPVSYVRYLSNAMREVFALKGIVFRVHTTAGYNPYDNSSK